MDRLVLGCLRNALASRLLAQGVVLTRRMVGPPVPGFELAACDQAFLDAFSGRRREILANFDRHGLPHPRAATQKAAQGGGWAGRTGAAVAVESPGLGLEWGR